MAARRRYWGSSLRSGILGILAALGLGIGARTASAQIDSARYASIVMDARTGAILEQVDADAPRHPASLAKLMTLYLTFEALRDRRISLESNVPVSESAAAMEPTKLGLIPGSPITVEQAILGIVTRSANDAAAALGEMLAGGSEARFSQLMTLRARAIGMRDSKFTNASGLPDPDAWTSARDMALLARRLITDFPAYYHYFSAPDFLFRGHDIPNHDNLLRFYPGADGLKTGYTVASGHNLVTSAVRGGVRLIGVELGCATNAERDAHMARLLDASFIQEGVPINDRPAPLLARVVRLPSLIASARAAEPERVAAARSPSHWVIQVGSFGAERPAHAAAVAARSAAGAGIARIDRARVRGHTIWRAQVLGLTPTEAKGTCSALNRHGRACVVLHSDTREEAAL